MRIRVVFLSDCLLICLYFLFLRIVWSLLNHRDIGTFFEQKKKRKINVLISSINDRHFELFIYLNP